ncbi:MAG: hypothetical protein HY562_00720 [Ignavibacteriales bacterium]|nr:hypothetical protein [Ignavibacteriales bacterium]
MKSRLIVLLLPLFFLGCKQEASSPVDDDFVRLYTELLLLSEEYKQSSNLSQQEYDVKIQEILRKSGTTKEEFTAQIQALSNDPRAFRQFTENVNKKLQERREKS